MHYYSLGQVPAKRHTQFESLVASSTTRLFLHRRLQRPVLLLHHCNRPPRSFRSATLSVVPKVVQDKQLKHRSLKGFGVQPEDDYLQSRKPVLVNDDCKIILAAPRQSMTDYFFKNADADEVIFIHKAKYCLEDDVRQGGIRIRRLRGRPRGTTYQMEFDGEDNRLFIVESYSPVTTPKRYRNEYLVS